MKVGADGKFPYSGLLDAMLKTTKNEGVAGLWVGFPTYYFRIAPHAMMVLLLQDFLTTKLVTGKKWVKKKINK